MLRLSTNAHSDHDNDRGSYDYPLAGQYLSIGQRAKWSLGWLRGPIATVTIGRRVLFAKASLDAFIASRTVRNITPEATRDE